jgi:laccase
MSGHHLSVYIYQSPSPDSHSSWYIATNLYFVLVKSNVLVSIYVHMRLKYFTLFGLTREWWNKNPIDVVNQATITGVAPNVSYAFIINGQPGDLSRLSEG